MKKYLTNIKWILFVALLIRLVVSLYIHPIRNFIFSDAANYVEVADRIIQGNLNTSHFFQPIGYSLLIALIKIIFNSNWHFVLAILQSMASTFAIYLIYRILNKEFTKNFTVISCWIMTLHIPFIIFDGYSMTESLSGLMTALVVTFFYNKKWLYLGITLAVSSWIKGLLIFCVPFLVLYFIFFNKEKILQTNIKIIIPILFSMLILGFYSQSKIGKFFTSPRNGGLNFVEGKCVQKWNQDSEGANWLSPMYYQLGYHNPSDKHIWNEPFWKSGYFFQQGLNCIIDRPVVLIQSLENIPFLWIGNFVWPINQSDNAHWIRLYDMIFAIFSFGGLIAFLFLEKNILKSNYYVWIIPTLALFSCVYIFKAEARLRVPFDYVLIVITLLGYSMLNRARKSNFNNESKQSQT